MPRLEADANPTSPSRPSRTRRAHPARDSALSQPLENTSHSVAAVFEELDALDESDAEFPPFAAPRASAPARSASRNSGARDIVGSAPPAQFFPAADEYEDEWMSDELASRAIQKAPRGGRLAQNGTAPARSNSRTSSAKTSPREDRDTPKTAKSKRDEPKRIHSRRVPPRGLWFEVTGVICLSLGVLLFLNALRGRTEGVLPTVAIAALRWAFGIGAYVVPLLLVVLGGVLVLQRQHANLRAFWRGAAVSLLVLLSGVHLRVAPGSEFLNAELASHGGAVGAVVTWILRRAVGETGAIIALVALSIVALLFLTEVSLSEIASRTSGWLGNGAENLRDRADDARANWREQFAGDDRESNEPDWDDATEPEPQLLPSRSRRGKAGRQVAVVPSVVARSLPLSPQDLARAQEEERERHSPFLSVDDLIDPQVLADDVAAEQTPFDTPLLQEAPEPVSAVAGVRIEIDQTAPPSSVVDDIEPDIAPLQVLADDLTDDEEPLTPNEALEAQALATAGQGEAAKKPRPQRIRRHFGDGPLMPEYFDDAVRALDPPVIPDIGGVEEDIAQGVASVQDTLLAFKIDARVTDVKRGPVITRYEVQPAPGVRVAAIANLDRDMARSLSAIAVRIEAPVPGKNVVGIEVPNKRVHLVRLRDVLEMPEFLSAQSKLAFVLGKDIAGQAKWADLTKMPHMLVAGATNSGKSVCLNTIISSIITRATPDEVKFSLIDPKRVELTLYRDIPHLYHPVVVEPKDAVKVLRGMIVEMDRRYKKFAERGVRNIVSFNQKLEEDEKPLPYIVIVIDELADLMMTAAAEFEKLICRLAQLARATGIHLIVATQRPSVNVITGVIKANIPARVAFAVASQVDSRTILDAVGAERLIGSGDMLFDANNGGKAVRIQGAYLSEEEVNRIVETVKNHYYDEPREYGLDLSAMDEDDDAPDEKPQRSDDRRDDLYEEIKEFALRQNEVSASMIQRKYEIGFPRAARIVDQFERDGILGPADGPKPRKVIGPGRD